MTSFRKGVLRPLTPLDTRPYVPVTISEFLRASKWPGQGGGAGHGSVEEPGGLLSLWRVQTISLSRRHV